MKHFTFNEFDSPDIEGSGIKMDKAFLDMLDFAREIYGKPMKINSGFRTAQHNAKVGGKKESSHLKGLAADISCTTSVDRWDLLDSLIKAGFNRIGIGNTFIHIDCDPEKAPFVIWTY
jgi:uncharacterized protein YcbK (DUF882 family)